MNSFKDVINWINSQIPNYQNQGLKSYKPDLNKMKSFNDFLGNPDNNFKKVHIAGTNGKGSTAHLISSVLQESGYKVGLYTSPHLKCFTERIKINGKSIQKNYVIDFFNKNSGFIKENSLSFFEITVGLAYENFSKNKVDISIIEVGLGGRLDATNIIQNPEVSIITNIGMDHSIILGDNRKLIAKEKAGIIKNKVKVVIGEKDKETMEIFKRVAQNKNAEILWTSDLNEFDYKSDLEGNYQIENMKCSYLALTSLKDFNISKKSIKNGFLNTKINTGISCRWEKVSKNPEIIMDVSHNKEGFKYVVEQLKNKSFKRLHMVLGFVNDKNIDEIFKILPKNALYYICKPSIARGMNISEIIPIIEKYQFNYLINSSPKEALNNAKKKSSNSDLIYVGGSTFITAELI